MAKKGMFIIPTDEVSRLSHLSNGITGKKKVSKNLHFVG